MSLRTLINEVANQADDFLDGFSSRKDARAGVIEYLAAEHPDLSQDDRKTVVDGVMALLEQEGFFDATPTGGWSEDQSDSENE